MSKYIRNSVATIANAALYMVMVEHITYCTLHYRIWISVLAFTCPCPYPCVRVCCLDGEIDGAVPCCGATMPCKLLPRRLLKTIDAPRRKEVCLCPRRPRHALSKWECSSCDNATSRCSVHIWTSHDAYPPIHVQAISTEVLINNTPVSRTLQHRILIIFNIYTRNLY